MRSRVCAIPSSATQRVSDIRNYIRKGKLWEAFTSEAPARLLIDEIDKADIEFPNDLLLELDRMEFHVYETGETREGASGGRSSSSPPTTTRSCRTRFCAAVSSTTSAFPTPRRCSTIVEAHFPGLKPRLIEEALKMFFQVRETPGLKKKPTTSELLDWLKLLVSDDISPETLRERDPRKLIPPLHGALLKNEQDVHLFERLAFLKPSRSRAT